MADKFPTHIEALKERKVPSAEQVKSARSQAGHTELQAANVLGVTAPAWAKWEAGTKQMPPNAFEYYLILTGQFQVGDLLVDPAGAQPTLLRIRTDDGRYISLALRDENIAILARRFTPYVTR